MFFKGEPTTDMLLWIYVYIEKTGDNIFLPVLSFLAIQGEEPGPLSVSHKITPCTKGRFIPKLWSVLQGARAACQLPYA